jgi:hypothetical protein
MVLRRIVSGVTLGVATCAVLGVMTDGCLTRPVVSSNPVTKTNFITSIPQGTIDKVDILFDIDNSASMGDKQAYLAQAVPQLITRLVQPNCVDTQGNVKTQAALDGTCPGFTNDPTVNAEFPPVHNLHIGIVSSSLGGRLGNLCQTTGPLSTIMAPGVSTPLDRHNDDQAHLLSRGADPNNLGNYTETPVASAQDGAGDNFLDWFPTPAQNGNNTNVTPTGPTPITVVGAVMGTTAAPMGTLVGDFSRLVVGTHQFGCGIESQLETWYRFLIQPDPYASLAQDKNGKAQWVGFDTTILAQRADFLRPDSLVAVIVLTDENDSEVDVRSFGGTGWNFMSSTFEPPRGTSACQSGNPATVAGASCTSCAFGNNASDPQCMTDVPAKGKYGVYPQTNPEDWGYDPNLRHVHEKQKYGVSVQFPIKRYVLGLTSTKVPNRDGEYPPDSNGDGGYASSYQGLNNLNCTNPLFAAQLPKPPGAAADWKPTANDLCNLAPSTRSPGLIFYAHIGGVPHQLLQQDPTMADSPQIDTTLTNNHLPDATWQLILGKDPESFDYTGIDPHMVESFKSRVATASVPTGGFPLSDTGTPEGSDKINGREWVTDSTMATHTGLLVDREYACIFPLVNPTTGTPTPRDCSDAATMKDPTLQDSCDCQPPVSGTGTLSHDELPAVCNDKVTTQQDSAKAYPTVRELTLAHLLGQVQGANEGIVSSLCPIHTFDSTPDGSDPLFGYRPAMKAIVDRLKQALSHQCLPEKLQIDPTTMQVPCLVLGTFPVAANMSTCAQQNSSGAAPNTGYVDLDATTLAHFKADQHSAYVQSQPQPGSTDPSTLLTCQLTQLEPQKDCSTGSEDGWCYIDTPGAVKGCAQAILFNPQAIKGGVVTSLQCIEANAGLDSGAPAVTPVATGDGGH